jgi:3-oxoacyl-[acyl-carrier protein] reductase
MSHAGADETPGRTAIVTGGTRGIGFGIARALAAEGWQLVVSGVRPAGDVADAIAELAALGAPLGAAVHYCASDIAVAADRAHLVGETVERFGRIDALINNAGRAPAVRADILDAGEESFEALVRTNLQGPYFLTQQVARHMVANGGGAGIVFVTSVSAELASITRGDYCISKAGLAMAVRLFAVRLAAQAIPVFEVRPGIIATDMTARVKDVYDQRIADGLVPEGRWGTPADVGRVIASLLRGDAPYATGSVIHVDGGLALGRL